MQQKTPKDYVIERLNSLYSALDKVASTIRSVANDVAEGTYGRSEAEWELLARRLERVELALYDGLHNSNQLLDSVVTVCNLNREKNNDSK